MFGTYLASEIRLLRRILESHRIDATAILRAARIDPALADRPRARYPSDRVVDAWVRGAEAVGNPDLGFEAARFYRPTDFHGLAVVFLASADLRTALGRLTRFHSVVNTAVKVGLEATADRLDLVFTKAAATDAGSRVIEDGRTAILVDLCRSAVAGPLDPVEVRFTYARPPRTEAHDSLFRCRLGFGADEWRVSFRQDDAVRPFQASNRELAISNDHVLEEFVRSLQHDDLVSRVKRAMVGELASGAPSEETIARAVSMSARSLQRRLAEEGTGFLDLLSVVRRDLAERYVADPSLPVTEISYMLGFSDLSSFWRAFKRWTGRSPAAARLAAGAGARALEAASSESLRP